MLNEVKVIKQTVENIEFGALKIGKRKIQNSNP
jgi:hypothetical protein